MKLKKHCIAALAVCAALTFTACAGSNSAGSAPAASSTTAVSDAAGDANATIDDLFQQENQLFADHADVWNKLFGMMGKSEGDADADYADFLAGTLEANKDSFTEEEIATLTADIETIRGIEAQIAELQSQADSADSAAAADSAQQASPFKNFSAADFDGNKVDDTLFSNNAVTVVNFWFTGCKPCVGELSKLNELNETLKAMGGEVVGINTETFDGNETAIADAKKVLESQNAAYRNLSLTSDSEAGKYASGIMAFPTTILVDRNGNIVGEPLLGGIDIQENYDALMQQIQSVVDADSANS